MARQSKIRRKTPLSKTPLDINRTSVPIDLVPVQLCGQVIHVQRKDHGAAIVLDQFYRQPGTTLCVVLGLAFLSDAIRTLRRLRD